MNKLFNDDKYRSKITLLKGGKDVKETYAETGKLLLNAMKNHTREYRTVVAINGPEGYEELLGITREVLEELKYERSVMSFGGNLSIRYQPEEADPKSRVNVFIYLTTDKNSISLLHFTKVVVPMLSLQDKRAFVLEPIGKASKVYKEIENIPSTLKADII